MPTEKIYAGSSFEVRGWVENDTCQVLEFLDELEENGDSDAERLYNLITRIADHGITHNKRHVRPLDNDIFEFKAPNTGRILFFYDKGRLIVCSHGFTGKKGNEQRFIAKQIEKAVSIKEKYFDEAGKRK